MRRTNENYSSGEIQQPDIGQNLNNVLQQREQEFHHLNKEQTNNLEVENLQAQIYGLKKAKSTIGIFGASLRDAILNIMPSGVAGQTKLDKTKRTELDYELFASRAKIENLAVTIQSVVVHEALHNEIDSIDKEQGDRSVFVVEGGTQLMTNIMVDGAEDLGIYEEEVIFFQQHMQATRDEFRSAILNKDTKKVKAIYDNVSNAEERKKEAA